MPLSVDAVAQGAIVRWGSSQARLGDASDAIHDTTPAVVLEPSDAAVLSDMLRWADAERMKLVIRGGGTKLARSHAQHRADVVLSTIQLTQSLDHVAGDLTVSAPAGARLADVNLVLARERQWLPLDPRASDRATIGGIVAANDSGPRRHLHGAPRDLVIGIEVALADGRIARAGGRVVKNVAGYDLSRLLCGSFGSLAVITRVCFKLAPQPETSRTVIAFSDDLKRLARLSLEVGASAITPSAIEIGSTPPRLLIRIESSRTSADRQATVARDICAGQGAESTIVDRDREASVWHEYSADLSGMDGTLIKLAFLPSQVADVFEHVERVATRARVNYRVSGRSALGILYVRLLDVAFDDASGREALSANGIDRLSRIARAHAATVEELRRNASARGGSAVVLVSAPGVTALVDPWGEVGDGFPLMQTVKRRFDPHGILNPGRGPGGL
jgi:glycolate dehydrogenase FAD-binding subunit